MGREVRKVGLGFMVRLKLGREPELEGLGWGVRSRYLECQVEQVTQGKGIDVQDEVKKPRLAS